MRPLFRSFRLVLVCLLTVRTVVILVAACISGATVGVLTYLTSHSLPQALLVAGTATSGCAHVLGQVIGTDPERLADGQDNNQDDDQNDSAGPLDATP